MRVAFLLLLTIGLNMSAIQISQAEDWTPPKKISVKPAQLTPEQLNAIEPSGLPEASADSQVRVWCRNVVREQAYDQDGEPTDFFIQTCVEE